MAGAPMGMAGGMASGAGFAPQQQAGFAPTGASNTQDTVLKYFQSYATSDVGCTITDAANAMSAQGVTEGQVRSLVEALVNEGHLYSTIDDEHYKATA